MRRVVEEIKDNWILSAATLTQISMLVLLYYTYGNLYK